MTELHAEPAGGLVVLQDGEREARPDRQGVAEVLGVRKVPTEEGDLRSVVVEVVAQADVDDGIRRLEELRKLRAQYCVSP